MKVVEIRGYQLGFTPAPAIGNARTMIRRRDFMLVELLTDTGARGWGRCSPRPRQRRRWSARGSAAWCWALPRTTTAGCTRRCWARWAMTGVAPA
ncbi:hypothetical protein ACFQU7_35950 [Pseudoroseomonas wenyumeiae]